MQRCFAHNILPKSEGRFRLNPSNKLKKYKAVQLRRCILLNGLLYLAYIQLKAKPHAADVLI